MKKILVLGAGAMSSVAVAFALGGGVASADDSVVGQSFSDAKAALSQQGVTVVVASTVGDRKDWNDCIVTSASPGGGLDGYGANSSGKKMNVNLNCYAAYSTGNRPGFSIQSPEAQKSYQADKAAKQQQDAAEAAAQQQAQDEQLASTDAQQAGE